MDIYAGGHYQQTGSDVIGMQGVGISGATVTIQNAEDTLDVHQTQSASSSGLHVYLKGGAADAATAAYQSARRADEVDDDRLSALYTAKAAQSLYAGGTKPPAFASTTAPSAPKSASPSAAKPALPHATRKPRPPARKL